MTKPNSIGLARLAVPFVILILAGLVGWGGHREQLKNHSTEIEKKVDKDVLSEYKEGHDKEHSQILKHLENIESYIKGTVNSGND